MKTCSRRDISFRVRAFGCIGPINPDSAGQRFSSSTTGVEVEKACGKNTARSARRGNRGLRYTELGRPISLKAARTARFSRRYSQFNAQAHGTTRMIKIHSSMSSIDIHNNKNALEDQWDSVPGPWASSAGPSWVKSP